MSEGQRESSHLKSWLQTYKGTEAATEKSSNLVYEDPISLKWDQNLQQQLEQKLHLQHQGCLEPSQRTARNGNINHTLITEGRIFSEMLCL